MKLEELTHEELDNYTTKLIPKLSRIAPYRWTPIEAIAKNVARFIDICQCLADHGYFNDPDGWLIIEVYKDSLVRIDPLYINSLKNAKSCKSNSNPRASSLSTTCATSSKPTTGNRSD